MKPSYEHSRLYYRHPEMWVQTADNSTTNGSVVLELSLVDFHYYCVNHPRNKDLRFKDFEFRGTSCALEIQKFFNELLLEKSRQGWQQTYADESVANRYDRGGW